MIANMNAFRQILDNMNSLLDRADACLDEREKRFALAMISFCESRLSARSRDAAEVGAHVEPI